MNLIFQRESVILAALLLLAATITIALGLSLDFCLPQVEIVQLIPVLFVATVFAMMAVYFRVLGARRLMRPMVSLRLLVSPFIISMLAGTAADFIFGLRGISQPYVMAVGFVTTTVAVSVVHFCISLYLKLRSKQDCPPAIVIIGNNVRSSDLLERWRKECLFPVEVKGYIDNADSQHHTKNPEQATLRYLGDTENLENILTTEVVDEIWMTLPIKSQYDKINEVVAVCETVGIPVRLSPRDMFTSEHRELRQTNGRWADDLSFVAMPGKPWKLVVKRLIDLFGSLTLLILASPVILAVALGIRLTSKGPIFFIQVRCGLHGRKFKLFKFRSMVTDADQLKTNLATKNESSGPVFKMKNDPRITTVGKFIRKASIDELPQLWNILRGDMSLVGPRPPVPQEVDEYQAWQRRRLSVKPGLTCTWQVSGRNHVSFEKWMQMDLEYIRTWSLRQDLILVAKTVPAVLFARGAY